MFRPPSPTDLAVNTLVPLRPKSASAHCHTRRASISNPQATSCRLARPRRVLVTAHHPRASSRVLTLLLAQYMHIPKFQLLYNRMTAESPDDTVCNIWLALLTRYLPQLEFIISRRQPPYGGTTGEKFILNSVLGAHGVLHMVLIEDERAFEEPTQASWEEALEQVTDYMIQTREEDKEKLEAKPIGPLPYDIYGIVNVGVYSRFYVLKSADDTLQDLPSGGGKAFHARDDELEIVAILQELVEKTVPHGFETCPYRYLSSSSSSSATSSRQASPAPVS